MPKYRKKPVTIEAIQFVDNASAEQILKWAGTPPISASIDPATGTCRSLRVETLEGRMVAVTGDWIIQGVQGEFYPCKPDIFDATYEAI